MGFGMGLGAFTQGLAGGLAIGDALKKTAEEDKLKGELSTIRQEAKEKFGDNALSDESYAYITKRSAAAMMAAGKVDEAKKFMTWADEAQTKANTQIFANGLRQIDTGDLDGFDKTLGKLGSEKGYGPQVGVGFARGDDGKIISNKGADGETYYRLKVTPPGAKEPVLQDVPAGKLKDVYARWFNPQAAFEADQAKSAEKSKRDADIKDYETKKGIDNKYADPQRATKDRGEAIDGLRKRDFSGKSFDDLPEQQKESEIQKELTLRRGSGSTSAPGLSGGGSSSPPPPSGRSVVMDRATGQPVKKPEPSAGGTGLAAQPQPNAAPGLPKAYPTSRQMAGPLAGQQPEDDLAAMQKEVSDLDRQIADTQARSANPDQAEVVLGPMRMKRAALDMRLKEAQGQRTITPAPNQSTAPPDIARRSADLDQVNKQIADIQSRPGGSAAYRDSLQSLEQKRGALLEELNAARRMGR